MPFSSEDAKYLFFSSEQTGTSSEQNLAHGLLGTPSRVIVTLTGGPAAYSQPTITQGAHDATNVKLTVTSGWKYQVQAWY